MVKIIEQIDSSLANLISNEAELEQLCTGLLFTEGPVWNSQRNCLFFVDIPGNTIYQYSETHGLEIYRQPSFYANGQTLNQDFQLITCEHQRRAVSIQKNNKIEVLCSSYQCHKLNSPNDVIIARDGSILFTDPIYGLRDGQGGPAIQELPFQGVYYLPPGAKEPTVICDDFDRPNGLAFNLNQDKLYVDDTVRQHIRVFHVSHDWHFSEGEIFAQLNEEGIGRPDGMKIDHSDNIFCTGPGGVWVFDPLGNLLGKIHIPEKTSNLAWGGNDRHSLYITAGSSLYHLHCLTWGKCPTDE